MPELDFRQWFETTRPVVLIASGAYNPIHRGHIQAFYHAKRFLSTQGRNVVAAYLIPRNADYIQKKSAAKGEVPVPDVHRQNMVTLAIKGTFIHILRLEKNLINLSRQQMRHMVQRMHPEADVIFVGGDDKGQCPNQEDTCLMDLPGWGLTVVVGRRLAGNASSTLVRQHLRQRGEEPDLLSPSVNQYIKQNRLWQPAERLP